MSIPGIAAGVLAYWPTAIVLVPAALRPGLREVYETALLLHDLPDLTSGSDEEGPLTLVSDGYTSSPPSGWEEFLEQNSDR